MPTNRKSIRLILTFAIAIAPSTVSAWVPDQKIMDELLSTLIKLSPSGFFKSERQFPSGDGGAHWQSEGIFLLKSAGDLCRGYDYECFCRGIITLEKSGNKYVLLIEDPPASRAIEVKISFPANGKVQLEGSRFASSYVPGKPRMGLGECNVR